MCLASSKHIGAGGNLLAHKVVAHESERMPPKRQAHAHIVLDYFASLRHSHIIAPKHPRLPGVLWTKCDFRRWKDHDGYKTSFQRMLHDLKLATAASK
jgi:hypothetical protein